MVLSELPTPVLLQSLAGGKSFSFFVSGQKSTRLNHCPVSSKLGIRNNGALGAFFKKLPGNWVLTPLLMVWSVQMLSPARPSPSLKSKLGDLLHRASAGRLEALRSPSLVALLAQDDKPALWDSSAISSHCLQPASSRQFRCYSTSRYLLVFSHSFGNDLPLEYFTHLWNFF